MPKKKKNRVLTLILVIACLLIAFRYMGGDDSSSRAVAAEEAKEVLEGHMWMDRWPEAADERLHVMNLNPSFGGGIYQDRTLYAGTFELFQYEIDGEKLRRKWPHTNIVEPLRFELTCVDGPKPFTYRLKLYGQRRGPAVYYGVKMGRGDSAWVLPGTRP